MTTDSSVPMNSEPDEPDEQNVVECFSCSRDIDLDTDTYHQGILWTYGSRHLDRNETRFYCEDCFIFCDDCEEACHVDNVYNVETSWSDRRVCSSCYDNYAGCGRCGSTYPTDDMLFDEHEDFPDEWLCNSCYDSVCYESSRSHLIRGYTYRPRSKNFWFVPNDGESVGTNDALHFAGLSSIANLDMCHGYVSDDTSIELHKRDLFLGLEIENNRTRKVRLHDAATYLLNSVLNGGLDADNYMYLKEDGSISGFEIVTHPATLQAHKVLLPREALPQLQRRFGLTGWQVVNGQEAGIHVHIGKAAFTHSHLHKFQMFQYRNQEYLKLFAGRDSHQYASFDKQQAWDGGYPKYKMSDFSKGDYEHDELRRYHAINFVPRETVELRYFRSSLKAETILAIIELVHAMFSYTNMHNSKFFRDNSFSWNLFREWVASEPEYEFLIPTMDRRNV